MIGMMLAFLLAMVGYTFGWFSDSYCPLCQQDLQTGRNYFWDVRTGLALDISGYLDGEHDCLWFSSSGIPQEISSTNQCGYARFPDLVTLTAKYCPEHRGLADKTQDFYILTAGSHYTICYPVTDKGTETPDGHRVVKQFNDNMNCWELAVFW